MKWKTKIKIRFSANCGFLDVFCVVDRFALFKKSHKHSNGTYKDQSVKEREDINSIIIFAKTVTMETFGIIGGFYDNLTIEKGFLSFQFYLQYQGDEIYYVLFT